MCFNNLVVFHVGKENTILVKNGPSLVQQGGRLITTTPGVGTNIQRELEGASNSSRGKTDPNVGVWGNCRRECLGKSGYSTCMKECVANAFPDYAEQIIGYWDKFLGTCDGFIDDTGESEGADEAYKICITDGLGNILNNPPENW